jgi:multiple sugar transport system permease protein
VPAAVPKADVLGARRRGWFGMSARQRRSLVLGLLFVSPWIVQFLALNLYPFVASLYFSLTQYSIIAQPVWIGLTNYQNLFTEDPEFWTSLGNTLYYTVFAVGLGTLIAIGLAMLLNMKVRLVSVYRTIFYLPSITPVVASSIVWIFLFNPQYGLLDAALEALNLPIIGWLSDPAWAKASLVIMSFWGLGGAMVIYLAGLQDVPVELLEAASLDGAGKIRQFRHITLPAISPVILFNIITGLIGSFQYFTQAYVMTNGGPADATLFYSLQIYRQAFQFFKMGYASAMAWILFVVVMAATLAVFRTSARWVYYGGK